MRLTKMNVSGSFACLAVAALSLACQRHSSDSAPVPSVSLSAVSASALGSAATSAPVAAVPPPPARPQHPAEKVLTTWNSALDRHDEGALAKLYAPYVRFYGVRKTIAEVLGAKQQAFKKEPDFHQRVSDVHIEKTAKGFVIRFEKQSGANFASSVPARLSVEGQGDELLITEESDSATDKRFGKPTPPSSCFAAVSSVVTALPAIEADIRRVSRANPQVTPGSILYSEDATNLEAAQGYFHPQRFEPRWFITVANGQLTISDALSTEPLALAESLQASVRAACSVPEADAGTKSK